MKPGGRLRPLTKALGMAAAVLCFVTAAFIFSTLPDVPPGTFALVLVSVTLLITSLVLSVRDRLHRDDQRQD
ncbi:hypothetical protein GCM10010176_036310 [Nonomuraea spiralis]|nr:hypothetical protein GCM10010176_036310 [Nonomuraea spiralis]